MNKIQLLASQKVSATIVATPAPGGVATITNVAWYIDSGDGAIGSNPAAATADLIPGASLGYTVYRAVATVDFGNGPVDVPVSFTMTVTPNPIPDGASVGVVFGTPTTR